MQINVDKNFLYKAVLTADSIVSSKNINTILSNCLINIFHDKMELISTDNEIAVRTHISSLSKEKFSFTVNGKKMASILKELPDDELVVNVDDNFQIIIKTKSEKIKGQYKLIGTSSQDFPKIPDFIEDKSAGIEQPLFKEIIKKVIYAASSDTIKPIFNGIFLVSETKGKLTAVATDSRRLSIITRNIEGSLDLKNGVILPLKTVNEIFRLLSVTGNCLLNISGNQCYIKIDETEIISRIVEGQFPNYKQVMPKEHLFSSEINVKQLSETIRRVIIFTREPIYKIILTFDSERLIVEASTPELGEATEEIKIKSDYKEKFSLGVNAQFMIEALKEMDCETVKCSITGQMSPMTLNPSDDPNFTAVIMPIQIKSSHSE